MHAYLHPFCTALIAQIANCCNYFVRGLWHIGCTRTHQNHICCGDVYCGDATSDCHPGRAAQTHGNRPSADGQRSANPASADGYHSANAPNADSQRSANHDGNRHAGDRPNLGKKHCHQSRPNRRSNNRPNRDAAREHRGWRQ